MKKSVQNNVKTQNSIINIGINRKKPTLKIEYIPATYLYHEHVSS